MNEMNDPHSAAYPVSVKGVLLTPDGDVVLLLNERDEWELPGGRIELGESSTECLAREIREELGAGVVEESIRSLGHHDAAAANEPGHRVAADLFLVRLDGRPQPGAEIVEMAWVDPHSPGDIELAPLTLGAVLDFVRVS